MILDDETLLSAYIDGELDAGARQRVEAALLADPALAEQLRQLAAVRDLVVALPPAVLRTSLSRSVIAAITAAPVGGPRSRSVAGRRRSASAGRLHRFVELGTAAAIVLCLTAGFRIVLKNIPPGLENPAPPTVARKLPAVRQPEAVTGVSPRGEGTSKSERARVKASAALARPANVSKGAISEDDREHDRALIRDLLDSPNLTRVFVITDVIGGSAQKRVAKVVEDLPRLDSTYGRITVGQGILIDPKHPDEATVFAVVINDDRELEQFRSTLKASFPDNFEETRADPAVVTQLADIGQVSVLAGAPMAHLTTPPRELGSPLTAIRSPAPEKSVAKEHAAEEFPGIPIVEVREASGQEGPTPQQQRSGPHPSTLGLKDPDLPPAQAEQEGATNSRPDENNRDSGVRSRRRPTVVLVWVTRQGRGNSRPR